MNQKSSRIIKFRAWDKIHKEMIYSALEINQGGFSIQTEMETAKPVMKQRDFVWQQYTGLLDRNGTEIYEGDILRWSDSDSIDDYQVIYEAPSFKYVSLSNPEYIGGKRAFDELEAEKDFEVIGNIYENPELLEAKS